MDKSKINEIYSSIKSSKINRKHKSEKRYDLLASQKYKECFKYFIQSMKNNSNHRETIKDMYLQSRDKYQKFVSNINNSIGFRFEGNKNYENLSLNNFKDDYKTNTINISKELENNSFGYFKPYNKKEINLANI